MVFKFVLLMGLLLQSLMAEAHYDKVLVLPFKWHNGHIVVQINVNGRTCLFQFDTGGHLLLSRELSEEFGLSMIDSVKMVDSNGHVGYMMQVDTVTIGFPGSDYIYRGRTLLETENGWNIRRAGIDGIIGSDVFQDFVVRINGRTRQLAISSKVPENLENGYEFVENISNAPIFRVQLAENFNIPMMFDSGNYSTMFLAQGVFDWLQQGGYVFEKVEQGYGLGMTGIMGGDPRRKFTRVIFKQIPLGGKLLKHVLVDVQPVAMPLLGSGILRYGEVVLDYPRKMFYFLPFDDIDFEQPISEPVWNIKLVLDPQQNVRVAGVWGELVQQVFPFDYVVAIDGKPIQKENLRFGAWGEIDLGKKDEVKLQIQRGDERIDVMVQRR